MFGRIPACGLLLGLVFGAGSCGHVASTRPKSVFHFDGPDISPEPVVHTAATLKGTAATYTVPTRQFLTYRDGRYNSYHESVYHPNYGPTEISGSTYSELEWDSPYFVEKSDDEVVPDGDRLVGFDVRASHFRVPHDGGSVWVRVDLTAPGLTSARTTGLNLVVLVDVSESMRKPQKLRLLKAAARSLVTQLLPSDRLAFVAFNDTARVLAPSGEATDRRSLLRQIDALRVGGGANLGAGLDEAYTQALAGKDSDGGPGHIILLSDGLLDGDSAAGWRSRDLARQKQIKGNRLSTVGLGSRIDPQLLSSLARAGEGRFTFIEEEKDVGRLLSRELESVMNTFAGSLRVQIQSDRAKVTAVHGQGIRDPGGQSDELILSDLVAGEKRSLLVRLRIPPLGPNGQEDIIFKLFFRQAAPVRRTMLEQTVSFRPARDFGRADSSVESYARLVTALELVRRALEGGESAYVTGAIEILERELPSIQAVALAEGDHELIELAALFGEFAAELRKVAQRGAVDAGPEWERLKREFYYRYR